MRGSRVSTYFTVLLLALACSASAAVARCHAVAAPVRNGQYYHGVKCVNPNGAAGCRCSGFYCVGMGRPHYEDVTCVPLFTVPR
jgi:hypothetical protein